MPSPHRLSVGRTAARSTVTFVALAGGLVAVLVALAPAGSRLASLVTTLPVAVAAVAAATAVTGRRSGGTLVHWRAGLAGAGAVAVVGSAWALATAPQGTAGVAAALAQLPVQAGAALVVLTAGSALAARAGRGSRAARAARVRRTVGSLLAGVLVGTFLTVPAVTATAAAIPPETTAPCAAGAEKRSYDVAAATVDVPFNRWGATLRSARIFVLEQDLAATKNWATPINRALPADAPENRRLRPRPLVLRANEGECVKVTLTNKLSTSAAHGLPANPRVGIQAAGMVVNARNTGGARVGFDSDPTVAIGQSITYYWKVPAQEGLFLFQDMATPAGGEHDAGSRGVGLYGAIAVEPAGSIWKDPRSGAVLSGNGPP
jgi:hypothetical protein